jgi:hypothetical protein
MLILSIWANTSGFIVDKRKKAVLNKHKLTRSRLEEIANQKSQGFPWLADAYAEYFHLTDLEIADYLEHKKHPARKSAEVVRAVATERRTAEKLYRILKYKLEYYENLFPFLVDYGEEEIDDLIKQTVDKMQKDALGIEDPVDEVIIWTTHGEREAVSKKKMSKQELFQKALDRYWQKQKSNWEIGRDYERYVGYLYEVQGYSVYYQGIIEGFEDLGRDLIATMTCPPKIRPVLMLDWRLRKGGYFIGQKTIQTGANHQQAP